MVFLQELLNLEDPVEQNLDWVNQSSLNVSMGYTYPLALRSLMRQDPEIIMVGEIRDLETAQMAIQAALTGHLVLSTLHTNDAPSSITRLLDLGLPSYLISSTILGVMAQRLVRTLCPNCKEEMPADEKVWNALVHPWKAPAPKTFAHPVGCLECRNTGYLGRQGIYEIMPLSEPLQKSINAGAGLLELKQEAMKEGMRTLRLSGAQKVAAGTTTIEEVLRVAPTPDQS